MMSVKYIILTTVIHLISLSLSCQNSFEIVISTEVHEYFRNVYTDNDSFIGVLSRKSPEDVSMTIDSLFIFDFNSNFEYWNINLVRTDTILNLKNLLIDNNGNYYLSVLGASFLSDDSIVTYFDGIIKFDVSKNFVWEKFYNRSSEAEYLDGIIYYSSMMELIDNNRILYVGSLVSLNNSYSNYYFIEYDKNGDTIKTKLLPQYYGTKVMSLTYNFDSSNFLLHKTEGSFPDCDPVFGYHDGVLILDTNQLKVESGFCYTNGVWNQLNNEFDAKITPSGELIVAGQSFLYNAESFPLGVFKFDTSFNLIKTVTLTNPDSSFYPGKLDNININSNNEIFIAGAFDHALGPFTSHYCKIYIAKLDTDLNVLNERYLGGDASYDVYSMASTSDGGCAIGGFKYDYKVNGEQEGDAFIIKTDPDLWVNIEENTKIPIHSVLCYPNPGNNNLNIRTTTYNSDFMLYDEYGRLILTTKINNLVTEINTSKLKRGVTFGNLLKTKPLLTKVNG